MTKDYWELNDELEAEKETILAEAEVASKTYVAMQFKKGTTICCDAEPYNDNEFCSHCYAKDPELHRASLAITEPTHGRFYAVDSNCYDGAPDATGASTIMGYGSTPREAVIDFWEQADEYPEFY